MRRQRTGILLIVLGILGTATVFGASAAAAEDLPTAIGDAPSSILVGVQGPADHGRLESYGPEGKRRWQRRDAASYHGVTQLSNGNVLAAFVVDSTRCGPYPAPCGRTGFRVIDPDTQQVVREWTYPVRSVPNSEVHDVEPLGEGRVLVAGMDRERVFIVNRSGRIVWQWHASSHYNAPPDPTRTDWLHINDVDRIGEGRFLVSVRNANQVIVIERGAGVVEVINENHDPDVLNHQHNPQWLGDGAVLVADSENNRVVELHRANGTWRPAWSVSKAGKRLFQWPRDADRLPNGNTLITDSRNNRVVLVDEQGDIVWQRQTSALPYEADVLGVGERVGGPTVTGRVSTTRNGRVPVFGRVLVALRHVYAIPWWVTGWHLLAAVVGLNVTNAGLYLLVTSGSAEGDTSEVRTAGGEFGD